MTNKNVENGFAHTHTFQKIIKLEFISDVDISLLSSLLMQ